MGNSNSVEASATPRFEGSVRRGAGGHEDGRKESHQNERVGGVLPSENKKNKNKEKTMNASLAPSESVLAPGKTNNGSSASTDAGQPRSFSASSLFGVMASTATSLLSSLPSSTSSPTASTKAATCTASSTSVSPSEEGGHEVRGEQTQDGGDCGKFEDGDEESPKNDARKQQGQHRVGLHRSSRTNSTRMGLPPLVQSGDPHEERFRHSEALRQSQESNSLLAGALGSLASAAAVHSTSEADSGNIGVLATAIMGSASRSRYGSERGNNNEHVSLATLAAAANAVYPVDSNELSQAVAYGASTASLSNNDRHRRSYPEEDDGVGDEDYDDEDDDDDDGCDDDDDDDRKDEMEMDKPVPTRTPRVTGRAASSSHHSKFSIVDKPRPTDILCGRGGGSIHHEGNKRFREEDVHPYFEAWSEASKTEKTRIARKIVKKIRDSGRRVLEKRGALWVNVTHNNTRVQTKIAQRLREYKDVLRRMAERGESPPKGTIPAVPLKVAVAEDDDEPPPKQQSSKERKSRGDEAFGGRGKRDREHQRRNADFTQHEIGSSQRMSCGRRESEYEQDGYSQASYEEANKRRKTADGRDRPDFIGSENMLAPTPPPPGQNLQGEATNRSVAASRREHSVLFGRHGADLVNAAQTDLRINDIVIPNPRAGGRGEQKIQDHEGNHRFRRMIKLELASYFASPTGMDRMRSETQGYIVREVFGTVSKLNPPGRFLCAATQSSSPSAFVEVPVEVALRFIENAFLIAGVMHGLCSPGDARLPAENLTERAAARPQVEAVHATPAVGAYGVQPFRRNEMGGSVADDTSRQKLAAGASSVDLREAEVKRPSFDSMKSSPSTEHNEVIHSFGGHEVTRETNDVLCGDDAKFFNHVGNRRFRIFIEVYLPLYRELVQRRADAVEAFRAVIDSIRSCVPPGRFLVKTSDGEGWEEMDLMAALRKTEQTFRLCDSFYRKRSMLPRRVPNVLDGELPPAERAKNVGTNVAAKPREFKISRIMVSKIVEHQHGLFVDMLQKELATTGKESDEDEWDGSADWHDDESNFFVRKDLGPNCSSMDALRAHYKESTQELQKAREEAQARARAARQGIMGWLDSKRPQFPPSSADGRAASQPPADSREVPRKWAAPLEPQLPSSPSRGLHAMPPVDFRQRAAQPTTLQFNPSAEIGARTNPASVLQKAPMGPPPATLVRGTMSNSLDVANPTTDHTRVATLNLPAMMLSQRMHQNVMNAGNSSLSATSSAQAATALGQHQERGISGNDGSFPQQPSRKVEPSLNSTEFVLRSSHTGREASGASLPASVLLTGAAAATNGDKDKKRYAQLPGKHIFQLTSTETEGRGKSQASSVGDSSSWMGPGMLQQHQVKEKALESSVAFPTGAGPANTWRTSAEFMQKLQQQQQSFAQAAASTNSSKAWMEKMAVMQQQGDPRHAAAGNVRMPGILPHQQPRMPLQGVRQSDDTQDSLYRLQHVPAPSMEGAANRNAGLHGAPTSALTPATQLQNPQQPGSMRVMTVGPDIKPTLHSSASTSTARPFHPSLGGVPASHPALPVGGGTNPAPSRLPNVAQSQPLRQNVAKSSVEYSGEAQTGGGPDRGQFDDA